MKKIILSLFSMVSICTYVTAQNVNDGIKFIYYERYTSAKETLQKAVAANPKDPTAIYWLGQAYIGSKQVDSAKTIYQNALNAGVNDPWIWVGSGEVEILQGGDINAAKQKFEQAITASTSNKGRNKGPNPDVLDAVGRAMAAGSSSQGDPNYGIDKLKQAAQIDPKNPDIFINLGLCYLKLGGDHGGEAFTAFQQATQLDPKYAKGYYRIGKVYQSQRNKESMDEWFGKAIAADATFAPVYLAYFNYYEEKDVNAAKEYLDKYVANADKDCSTDYFVGDYLFRAGKYQESLNQANSMQNGNCKNYARLNVLYAYDYDRLGDSLQARSYIQKFFAAADTSDIQPADYAFAGTVLAKFPETSDSAITYLQRAVTLDTVKENQNDYLNSAVSIATKTNNYGMLLKLINTIQKDTSSKLSELQYFNISKSVANSEESDTTGAYDSTKYLLGDSIIQKYISAYSDKPQPYSFQVRYAKYADKDTSRGLAIPAIMQQNQFLSKDTAVDAKKTMFANDVYLLIYYAQYDTHGEKAENYQKAIDIGNQMMALYPDPGSEENKYAAGIKSQLQGALDKYQKAKASGGKSGNK